MEKVLITGATGLIGKNLVPKLLDLGFGVVAVVRNKEKAINLFGEENDKLSYVVSDINDLNIAPYDVDYIIHAASQTSSKKFVSEPVETVMTSIKGTVNLLEIARLSSIKSFIYLSSMEVYGYPTTDEKIDESHGTNIDVMKARSCYPESKRMCECLCASYFSEYNVPIKVVRLTQTFGPGVNYNDDRVFAEFARCAVEKRDIVLKTKGDTKRCYLYTDDAVDAILSVMHYGTPGEAYNVANESTYCSIYEMANLVANEFGNNSVNVVINETNSDACGYAPTLHMNLDTTKIRKLGWAPKYDLKHCYSKMIEEFKDNRNE